MVYLLPLAVYVGEGIVCFMGPRLVTRLVGRRRGPERLLAGDAAELLATF